MHRLIFPALLLAAATSAQAQPSGGAPHARLFISPAGEPFRGGDGLAAWFDGADTDHDGALTPPELRADFLRFFKTLDTDGDGRLDGFELQAYERDVAPEITRIAFDESGPGAGQGGPRMGGGRRGGRGGAPGNFSRIPAPGGRGGGGGRQGAGRFGLLNIPQPVANADEDIDGRISLDEWTRAATRRFALLDKDRSGKLALDRLRPPAPQKK